VLCILNAWPWPKALLSLIENDSLLPEAYMYEYPPPSDSMHSTQPGPSSTPTLTLSHKHAI
jgi:hypothetical protein